MEELKNKLDTLSLNEEAFFNTYDGVIEKTIQFFISKERIELHEKDDYFQHVREKMLLKLPKIIATFKGESSFKTYLISIIRNICKDEIARIAKDHFLPLNLNRNDNEFIDPLNNIVIQQELSRLEHILCTYPKYKNKILLCLKLKFRIPFSHNDFVQYNKNITLNEYNTFKLCLKNYPQVTDEIVYSALNNCFCTIEGKTVSSDSLRKWIAQRIEEIIRLLNTNRSNYAEDTFQILFEYFVFDSKNN
jgi:RNA polymerase sigma factor (sigma-70 family)